MEVTNAKPQGFYSEMVKLVTLRSVWVSAASTAVVCVVMAGLTAPSIGRAIAIGDPNLAPGTVPETVGLEWIGLGLIGILTVGVLAGSQEFIDGQLSTSLVAAPARWRLLVTKSLALLVLTGVTGAVTIPGMSLLSQVGLGSMGVVQGGVPSSLAWRWLGGLLLWAASAQLAFAVAVLMKQSVIPLFIMLLLSQITLPLVNLVPFSQFFPFAAGTMLFDPAMITSARPSASLPPVVAGGVLLGWTGLLLGAALVRFIRRDARA